MVRSSQPLSRRRFFLLLMCGVTLLVVGVIVRLIATDAVAQWKASRMSDVELAKAAGAPGARYSFISEWARRQEANARFREGELAYARAMETEPSRIEAWLGFGRTSFAARDWGRTTEVLAKTVQQWPDNAEARFAYAAILASTFRVRMAIRQLEAGIKLDPNRGEAFVTLGDLQTRAGNAAEAVKAYDHARKLLPNAKRMKSRYGGVLVNAGRYLDAQPVLEAALKEDPSDINARFDMGKALANDGKPEDRGRAMQELNRVVQFSANKSRAYLEAARVWLREKDYGNGIQALEHAYDLSPYNLDILTLLAQSYEAEGRPAEARKVRKDLAEAQALTDARKEILAHLDAIEGADSGKEVVADLIRLGRADINAHNTQEARNAFEAAQYLDPDDGEAARELKKTAGK